MIILNVWIAMTGFVALLMGAYALMVVAVIFNLASLTGMFRLWKDGE
jgi:hypothetical protein